MYLSKKYSPFLSGLTLSWGFSGSNNFPKSESGSFWSVWMLTSNLFPPTFNTTRSSIITIITVYDFVLKHKIKN